MKGCCCLKHTSHQCSLGSFSPLHTFLFQTPFPLMRQRQEWRKLVKDNDTVRALLFCKHTLCKQHQFTLEGYGEQRKLSGEQSKYPPASCHHSPHRSCQGKFCFGGAGIWMDSMPNPNCILIGRGNFCDKCTGVLYEYYMLCINVVPKLS